MSKQNVEKKDFYPELLGLMSQATSSVCFYSISCCFGFYSLGLNNFEKVLIAIRERLAKKIKGKFLDIRVLVKIDKANPIDVYASERLAALGAQFSHISNDEKRRVVFKGLEFDGDHNENVQFIIIDDKKILISKIQEEDFNVDLDLVLNKSESGLLFEKEEFFQDFQIQKDLFEKKWYSSSELDINVKQLSKRKLIFHLTKFKLPGFEKTEREVQFLLHGYLQNHYSSPLYMETTVGKTRIDIVIGTGATHEKDGIELKYMPTRNSLKEIIGQMEFYRNEFQNIFLLICKPQYDSEDRKILKEAISKNNITLIEIN